MEERLELYFASHNNIRRWIHILQDINSAYNNSVHSAIDRTPNSVTRANARELFDYLELKRKYQEKTRKTAKFYIGDLVRLPIDAIPGAKTNTFKKGARAKWTKELYEIIKTHYGTFEPTYTVTGPQGQILPRRYYESEINFVKTKDEE